MNLSAKKRYRYVLNRDDNLPVMVLDREAAPDLPLTLFASSLSQSHSAGSIPIYLRELLCLCDWLASDSIAIDNCWSLTSPAKQFRTALSHYLLQEGRCKIVQRPDSHKQIVKYIARTSGTRIHPNVLFVVLKGLFDLWISEGIYADKNPMVCEEFAALQRKVLQEEREAFRVSAGRNRMPTQSGVDPEPAQGFRLSDNYFRLVGDKWIPQTIADQQFPAKLFRGGRKVGWDLRGECATRSLFESGARISEVLALTFGDWARSGFLNGFAGPSKGSNGVRVKELLVSTATVKLLQRYVNDDKTGRASMCPLKLNMRRVKDARQRPNSDEWKEISKQPIFITRNGRALTPAYYRIAYWRPALKAAKTFAQPHQARHFFVTTAIENARRLSKKPEDLDIAKSNLIAYMSWKSGERTLRLYEHSVTRAGMLNEIESVHRVLAKREYARPQRVSRADRKLEEERDQVIDAELRELFGDSHAVPDTKRLGK